MNKNSFRFSLFTKNLSITSAILLILGVVSANLPIFNFINYYVLGLQRYGVESKTPFAFDEYAVKISWRGIFPSSETIGEFYGLCLLCLMFYVFNTSKVKLVHYVGIFTSSLGLYFSDNRTTMTLVFISSLFYFFTIRKNTIKIDRLKILYSLVTVLGFTFIYFIQSNISTNGYTFMSDSVIVKALTFQKDYAVSSFSTLITSPHISDLFRM